MIVIELTELLSEWWFPLSTTHGRAFNRRLGYTVQDGIEAAGQIKCPRTAGVGYVYE